MALLLDQRTCLVLRRHHDGHSTHAVDVGGCDGGGGQRWRGWSRLELPLQLAVGLRQLLGLGQMAVALLYRRPIGGLGGDGLSMRQRAAVVVAVMSGSRGSLMAGRSVAGCTARGCDDGGSV